LPQKYHLLFCAKFGKSKINKEKVKNIFTVVSKRGVMLKLKADQIKIN